MDRIESAVVTGQPVQRPVHVRRPRVHEGRFRSDAGKKGGGGRSFFRGGRGLLGGGEDLAPESGDRKAPRKRLRLRLNVAVTPELAAWVTSFGGEVEVIRPRGLREAVRKAGEEIVRRYGRE